MADQDSTLQPGDVVAEYRIEKVLGSGSFGVTYLALDTHLSRAVAIKEYMPAVYARRAADGTVSSRNLDTSATFEWGLERFSEEARTLAQFNHPNIVRVLRLVQGMNGTAYIAMELLEGRNLETIVEEEGPLSPERFLSVFRQLLDGCESIHRIGILHRDIKPANIVIRDQTPVLIDFGAARDLALQQKAGFSALVTDGFSPLEQYSKEIQQTEATDIYALAATAYFLLTGRIPPPSAARSCGEAMPSTAEVAAGSAPADILKGIDWGLALRMADRPKSIGEWRKAMPSLDSPAPGSSAAAPPPAAAAASLPLSRRGLLIAGGGLAVAGVASIALFSRDTSLSGSQSPLRPAWTKRIALVAPYGDPYAAVAVANGAALIAAQQFANESEQLLALRIDGGGATQGKYVSPDPGSSGHAVLPAADGGAWIGGGSGSKSLLVRLDKDWKPVWSQTYGEGSITSILPRPAGVIAAMEGPQSSGTAKLLFVRPDGSLEREATLLDRQGDSIQGIAPLPGGDLAVLGGRFVDGQSELWVARASESGRDLWRKSEAGLGFANGWGIVAVNGKIYVSGRTSPDGSDDGYRLLLMRLDAGDGAIEWRRWDYREVPSSGHGLAVAGEGSGARLYASGWGGKPRRARLIQIGPNGDLVWDPALPPPTAAATGATDLALGEDGSGFGIGLEAPDNETLHLTLTRFS
jgi:tRNA A-37 threonylcarbamoyl transferase component Bud32